MGIVFDGNLATLTFMKNIFSKLTSDELKSILIEESKKFIAALDYGPTENDLEEIIEKKRIIENILREREGSNLPSEEGTVGEIDDEKNLSQKA